MKNNIISYYLLLINMPIEKINDNLHKMLEPLVPVILEIAFCQEMMETISCLELKNESLEKYCFNWKAELNYLYADE